ncbi:unnamed protein product [Somion occarium]|uniref:Uncharacterized protein n=1 Tax=Somion occarium TaxID=3059160 RepID=A0ABP1D691_9APHY
MPVPLSPKPTNVQQTDSTAKPSSKDARRQPDANQTIRNKKEAAQRPPLVTKADSDPVQQQTTPATQSQTKKLARKSSKPFINWFQRKLAGTRARRASDGDALRAQRISGTRSPNFRERRRSSVPVPPLPATLAKQRNNKNVKQVRPASIVTSTKPNTISLNEEDDYSSVTDGRRSDSVDPRRTSSALDSTWSPNSVYEADEDASMRPIPPSTPPSPSPSRSSSSYLSDPRTFASMAASTKPTTLLSVDLTGGMAHIAQAPPTPTIPTHRLGAHLRTHSSGPGGGSITFSVLPPTTAPSRPSSTQGHVSSSSRGGASHGPLQAPQHTTHHPRNNPRPSSPPMDDASVLTLASSAFGIPGRVGVGALALSGRTSIADDSISHFSHRHGLGDSTSHFLVGDADGEGDDERLLDADRDLFGDIDASVRALRPRSSRRGSWESEASGWSARLGGTSPSLGPGTPSGLRERSLWTNGSYRTGPISIAETEGSSLTHAEGSAEEREETGVEQHYHTSPPSDHLANNMEHLSITSTTETDDTAKSDATEAQVPPLQLQAHVSEESASTKEKSLETPKRSNLPLQAAPPLPPSDATPTEKQEDAVAVHSHQISQDDLHSLATSDNHTDTFVSAPSTPLPY